MSPLTGMVGYGGGATGLIGEMSRYPADGSTYWGDRAVGQKSVTMEYWDITTTSGVSDFGDSTVNRTGVAVASDGHRGVFTGGQTPGGNEDPTNTIDYVVIATTSNATDFGDDTKSVKFCAGCSDGSRGCRFGGIDGHYKNDITYITIATPSNATNFADIPVGREMLSGTNSATQGFVAGGWGPTNVIEKFTIQTLANATDLGDLTVSRYGLAATASSTRAIWAGGKDGSNDVNTIDRLTMATGSDASDFGDMTAARRGVGCTGNGTRGIIAGGYGASGLGNYARLEYVTIDNTSNATEMQNMSTLTGSDVCCTSGAAS
tara:strand:+ start:4952 stop:5908 length:957 start_codon:yes stop_codon:yes gene_type:complete